MSYQSSIEAKEQIRQAVDIVDLMSDYLPLRREGRGYKALCPWHNDSRPSLQINPERQSFRCWVCDIGGDIFSFVMKSEGVTFPEALSLLADRAGIQLDQRGSPEATDKRRSLLAALQWAEQQYHDCLLKAPEAQAAREYLAERQITAATIAQAKLGFSPDQGSWLQRRASMAQISVETLERIGVLAARQQGDGHYDRFHGRVLFSIRDPQGRPVGFGGRVLPGTAAAERGPKYVNSPETPLFSKSSLLYGLDLAKDAMARSRTALVMEGYTDCLIARQAGFTNAVAVLGTALGERHIKTLRRFVDTIVLVLDGDEAGRRRTEQVLELFVAEQMDLRVLTLPDELDPAEFLQERGSEAMQSLIDRAPDAFEHRFALAMEGVDARAGVHAVLQAVEAVLSTLSKAPRLQGDLSSAAQLREDSIVHRLARRSGLEETRLRQRLSELRAAGRKTRDDRPQTEVVASAARPTILNRSSDPRENRTDSSSLSAPQRKLAVSERWILEILLEQPELLTDVRRQLRSEQFADPCRRALFDACCRLADSGVAPTFERLMLEFDELDVKNLLVDLDDERQAMRRPNVEKELRELLELFDEEAAPVWPSSSSSQPRAANRTEEDELEWLQKVYRQKLSQHDRSRQSISAPTEG